MSMGEKNCVISGLLIHFHVAVSEVIFAVQATHIIESGQQTGSQQVDDAVELFGLKELGEVLAGLAEAHAEVEPDAFVGGFEENLVAADFVDAAVECKRVQIATPPRFRLSSE